MSKNMEATESMSMMANVSSATGPLRKCKLEGCEVEFRVPAHAKHKVFCCAAHRNEHHTREVQAALAAARAKEGEPEE